MADPLLREGLVVTYHDFVLALVGTMFVIGVLVYALYVLVVVLYVAGKLMTGEFVSWRFPVLLLGALGKPLRLLSLLLRWWDQTERRTLGETIARWWREEEAPDASKPTGRSHRQE
jgi:hypothetical protein